MIPEACGRSPGASLEPPFDCQEERPHQAGAQARKGSNDRAAIRVLRAVRYNTV